MCTDDRHPPSVSITEQEAESTHFFFGGCLLPDEAAAAGAGLREALCDRRHGHPRDAASVQCDIPVIVPLLSRYVTGAKP